MISEHSDHDALAARLAAIDSEPLEDRAAGFARLHEELRERLSGGEGASKLGAGAGVSSNARVSANARAVSV